MKASVALLLLLGGCAGSLPSFPSQTTLKAPPDTFTGDKCRVRVEPLLFDPRASWGGVPEGQFVATLRPQAQQSHEQDKVGVAETYYKHVEINERDYVKDRGKVTLGPTGSEPYVLRSRVVSVDTSNGALHVIHQLLAMPDGRPVAEFSIQASNIGYGLGQQLRNATIPQAWTVLKYLSDRFACTSPARVVD